MCNEQRRRIALGGILDDWSRPRIPFASPSAWRTSPLSRGAASYGFA